MNIKEMKVNDLIPYNNNPRDNSEAIKWVKESIQQFGFKVPIVIDKNNLIIAGHTRLEAAKELNLTTVPVIKAADLTDEQAQAFRLADNKVAEFSQWNMKKLQKELDQIQNIDMEAFGFEELQEEAEKLNEPEEDIEYKAETFVLVECDDEQHAAAVMIKLSEQGYDCRLTEM